MSFKNMDTALENMVIVRDALAKRGVPLYLNFGTLLGAIREHDFIPHDHDVDTGIFLHHEHKLVEALPEMAEQGLIVHDVWKDNRCYSLERGDEQIDIFVAHEKNTCFGRKWNLDGKTSIPAAHLDQLDKITFRGEPFSIPHDPERLLRNLYGKTWNIPIDGKASRIDVVSRIRTALRRPLWTLRYIPTFVKRRVDWAASSRKTMRAKGEHK